MQGPTSAAPSGSGTHRPLLRWIFISPAEPRLRAGWRLAVQIVLQIAISILLILPLYVTGVSPDGSSGSFTGISILPSLAVDLMAVTLSTLIARRFLDRRSFRSLGLQVDARALPDFVVGIATTLLMMGLIFLAQASLGWLSIKDFVWQKATAGQVSLGVLVSLVLCLMVAWREELMSRGYHLQTIASGTSLTWGWVVSSAIFALLHLANPHANLMAVAGILLAGLFLGYAYVRTGRLWLAMGLHTGWNFFEGVVFGFPVSGLPFYALPRITISGPELWTGGPFGPEAGLVVVPALAIGFLVVTLYTRSRRVPPSP